MSAPLVVIDSLPRLAEMLDEWAETCKATGIPYSTLDAVQFARDAGVVTTAKAHAQHVFESGELWRVAQAHITQAAPALREQIARALERRASDASYAYPEEVTDTYLDAARIARADA